MGWEVGAGILTIEKLTWIKHAGLNKPTLHSGKHDVAPCRACVILLCHSLLRGGWGVGGGGGRGA